MPNWQDLIGGFRIYSEQSWLAFILVWGLILGLLYSIYLIIKNAWDSRSQPTMASKGPMSYKRLSRRIWNFMEIEEVETSEFLRFLDSQGIQCAIDMFFWTPSWGWKSITWLRAADDQAVNRWVRLLKHYIVNAFTVQDPYIRALGKYLEEKDFSIDDVEIYAITERDLLLAVPTHFKENLRDLIENPTRDLPYEFKEIWNTIRGPLLLCTRKKEKREY